MAKNADDTSMIEEAYREKLGVTVLSGRLVRSALSLKKAHVVGKGVEYEMPLACPNKAQIGKARRGEPFAGDQRTSEAIEIVAIIIPTLNEKRYIGKVIKKCFWSIS